MFHLTVALKSAMVALCAAQAVAHMNLGWCGLGLVFVWLVARDIGRQSEADR